MNQFQLSGFHLQHLLIQTVSLLRDTRFCFVLVICVCVLGGGGGGRFVAVAVWASEGGWSNLKMV